MIGGSDAKLIMKSCTAGGRLLRPHRPMAEIDATFKYKAFQTGANGHIWSSHSFLGDFEFAYVLVADLQSDYSVTLSDIRYRDTTAKLQAIEANATTPISVDASTPLKVKACKLQDFQIYSLSPELPNGWTLLGELNKWVTVSSDRFSELDASPMGAAVTATGTIGETITVSWMHSGTKVEVDCTFPHDGSIRVAVDSSSGKGSCLPM